LAYETLPITREASFAIITLNWLPANAINVRDLSTALSSVESEDASSRSS
jgi:hypothetical protein